MLLPPSTLCGCIGGAIVSLLTYNAVDHWFKSKPGQTKDKELIQAPVKYQFDK
jgi:hypothetical protein